MNTSNINASQNTDVVPRAILLLKQLMSRNIFRSLRSSLIV